MVKVAQNGKLLYTCGMGTWKSKNRHKYMETDKDHVYFLVSYDATDRVCDIVKAVKQQIIYYLWQKYSDFLSKQY